MLQLLRADLSVRLATETVEEREARLLHDIKIIGSRCVTAAIVLNKDYGFMVKQPQCIHHNMLLA